MMRAASSFWSGNLAAETSSAPGRSLTSTAAPWWKTPDAPTALDPAAWAALWFPAAASHRPAPVAANPFMAAWAPWFPAMTAPASTSPIEVWQRAWLQNMPQFSAFGASLAGPASVAALPAVPAPWQPVATAYRSANGHAMAAVLRTMADVVEPKRDPMDLTHFWFNALGTRH